MEKVIHDLISVPGVIGSYVFLAGGEIPAREMPSFFTDGELVDLGRLLQRIYATGNENIPAISEIMLSCEESIIIGRPASENVLLVVLFEPTSSTNLLHISLNLAMDKLRLSESKKIEQPEKEPATEEKKAPPTPSAASLLADGSELRKPLVGMQECLVKIMGPMAKVVFNESLNKLISLSTTALSTRDLPKLVDIISWDLADPDKERRYRSLVIPVLEANMN